MEMSGNHLELEIQKTIQDIKDLKKVQGNTNVAKTVAKTLLNYITHSKPHDVKRFVDQIKEYGHDLSHARPNEPLSVNAVAFITKDLEKCENQQQVRIKAIERIEKFFKYIDESYEVIRVNATNLLKGYNIFYTHCHSSLARDVIIRVHEFNGKVKVINDETRPLYQGRITAAKLSEAGIPVTHVVDSAAGSIFLDDRYPTPHVALVGSDGVTIDGGLINKVGTYNVALAAYEAKIPFYAVTQFMKIDFRSHKGKLQIEMRDNDEIWDKPPKGVEILNPAFDLVPGKYITGGFITEKGLIKPEEIRNYLS
jgi:ribose 1,5-bisphosphate isomerase